MVAHEHVWNKDVERSVLAVLLDGRHASAWGTVVEACPHPGYFFSREHQLIVLVMTALAERGIAISSESVAHEAAQTVYADAMESLKAIQLLSDGDASTLSNKTYWKLPPPPTGVSYDDSLLVALGGFNAVTDLAGAVAFAGGLARNGQIIADHYRQRRLVKLLSAELAALQSPKGVATVEAVGSRLINGASRELGRAAGDVTMAGALDEALVQHDLTQQAGGARVASWGIDGLDDLVPLTADTFAVLAAPPKCGKTSLCLQAVEATAKLGGADSVCLVSREMSPPELARILVARRLGIPASDVRDGQLTASEVRRVQDEADHWRREPAIVIQGDADRVSVDDICAWARLRHMRAGGRLRLIVVDYLQLLDGTTPRQTEYERISFATRRLKLLQRSLRVPVLVLSQLNREGTKSSRTQGGELNASPEPQLADLRGSGSIEQDANAVVMLWPRQEPTAAVQGVTIKVAANRSGPVGVIHCRFLRAKGQVFEEVIPERRTDKLNSDPSDAEDLFK